MKTYEQPSLITDPFIRWIDGLVSIGCVDVHVKNARYEIGVFGDLIKNLDGTFRFAETYGGPYKNYNTFVLLREDVITYLINRNYVIRKELR